MKQYLLSVCYPAGGTQPQPDALQRITRDVHAVQKEMQAAGVWVFSGGLHPPSAATVLRHQSGEIVTTDGPFIESKEQTAASPFSRRRISMRHSAGAESWREPSELPSKCGRSRRATERANRSGIPPRVRTRGRRPGALPR
jgi:hypothetical protein